MYQECWCCEGQTGIFHPSIGEGRRKHQDVILPPNIRSCQVLGRLQHRLRLHRRDTRRQTQNDAETNAAVRLCTVCVWFCRLTSENSNAALSTNSFSDQTLDRGPISLSTNQSTGTRVTCCGPRPDSEWVRRIPALQSSDHDGNQVRWHGHLRSEVKLSLMINWPRHDSGV